LLGKPFSRISIFVSAIILLIFEQSADAHLVSTGAGPFYDGSAHFFLTLEEILPVIALSLFAGLRGAHYARWIIVLLPLTWILSALAAFQFPIMTLPPAAVSILMMLLPGALLASDLKLSKKITIAITVFFGLLLGFLNGIAMTERSVLEILGSATSALVVSVLSASLAVALDYGWTRIAIRVAGSWLAALGLLALGWSLRR
jgi:hydrogenase/urease accessory protein HupE